MKLHEKIAYYRKKSGKSQESLAEILGVSRQAVSKWETGDSQPELVNLLSMARTFGVTTDHLLSDEDAPEGKYESKTETGDVHSKEKSTGKTFGTVSRLTKKYGWFMGIYAALSGVPFLIVGLIMRAMVKKSVDMIGNVELTLDKYGSFVPSSSGGAEPMMVISTIVIGIGLAVIIGGVILAVYLRKKLH